MNIVGLIIGIIFWSVILWAIDEPPVYVKYPIIIVILILAVICLYKAAIWARTRKTNVEP